jgi:hypothetical protein
MKTIMKTISQRGIVMLAVVSLATLLAPLAGAECGAFDMAKPAAFLFNPSERPFTLKTPSLLLASDDNHALGLDPIVGFWRATVVAQGNSAIPDGTVIDKGFTQLHSDGTEILNSSRPPATSSYCMGVWKKTAKNVYIVNHFAISWTPAGTLIGIANIHEEVALNEDGDTYTGTFTIDQYDQAGNKIDHVNAVVTARRITTETTITDVL